MTRIKNPCATTASATTPAIPPITALETCQGLNTYESMVDYPGVFQGKPPFAISELLGVIAKTRDNQPLSTVNQLLPVKENLQALRAAGIKQLTILSSEDAVSVDLIELVSLSALIGAYLKKFDIKLEEIIYTKPGTGLMHHWDGKTLKSLTSTDEEDDGALLVQLIRLAQQKDPMQRDFTYFGSRHQAINPLGINAIRKTQSLTNGWGTRISYIPIEVGCWYMRSANEE